MRILKIKLQFKKKLFVRLKLQLDVEKVQLKCFVLLTECTDVSRQNDDRREAQNRQSPDTHCSCGAGAIFRH
jgi:hypothetical protein